MKIFLDSNILLRFYTQDNPSSYKVCNDILSLCRDGQLIPYSSNVVIQEIIYVLVRLYKFPKPKVHAAIVDMLKIRNLTLIEKTNTKLAIAYFKRFSIKFADCLIATQLPKGVMLCTYDTDFTKIKKLSVADPKEILATMKSRK